jgi:uridylate kinase
LTAKRRGPPRVLLKISGEAFGKTEGAGLSSSSLAYLVQEIAPVHSQRVQLGIVVGGGNLVRGARARSLDRVVADRMGMLNTIINGLALYESLQQNKIPAVVQSAVPVGFLEPVDAARARAALDAKQIVIFVGGTGNAFVTTDTAAAIRAGEIRADLLLKATDVSGVYTSDPKKSKNAKLLHRVSYEQVLLQNLAVMDLAAVDICRQNKIPIVVFDFFAPGNLKRAIAGEEIGTIVK